MAVGDGTVAYVRWEEVVISGDKGRRVVHYYLKDAKGRADLAVVGLERTARHMSYDVARLFLNCLSDKCPTTVFPVKLRSRREVVEWLSSFVSESLYPATPVIVDEALEEEGAAVQFPPHSKGLPSGNLRHHSKDFLWIGTALSHTKRRKHYMSFSRNGVMISIHDFVYILGEEYKRHIAYIVDMYEDMKDGNMVSIRWFHKVDEVGIALPSETAEREIFFTHCYQDLSVECIDGLAVVLSPQDFEKHLKRTRNSILEPHLCRREIENDEFKAFDINKIDGYEKQNFLKDMHASTLRLRLKLTSSQNPRLGDSDKEGDLKCLSNGNVGPSGCVDVPLEICRDKFKHMSVRNKTGKERSPVACLPGKEAFKQKFHQQLSSGSLVEVLSQDSGMRGCWFRCIILKRHSDKVKVQYQDIQDVDGTGGLLEWLLLSRIAKSDNFGIRLSGRPMVRPHPYPRSKVPSGFNVGSVVDAWWNDGWWEGIVIRRESEHQIYVHFPDENQTAVFGHGELRHSQEWICGKWTFLNNKPDLVKSILADRTHENCGVDDERRMPSQTHLVNGKQETEPEEMAACGMVRLSEGEYPTDKLKEDISQHKQTENIPVPSWGSSKKRSISFVGKERSYCKRPCYDYYGNTSSSQKIGKESSQCFVFSLPKSLAADSENCKLGGDSLFGTLAISNLVMTR